LQWSGRESIPAPRSDVWRFINEPRNIASCLPGVVDVDVHDEHTFDATVQVAVGPVRGKFKFKIALDPKTDERRMDMKISGGGFGSVVDLLASADLEDEARGTALNWEGTATMRGPLATVGGAVLDAQARRVISTTFANVKARMAGAPA
jgi:carbon monoxide dehydrogenase subunit G